MTRRHWIAAAAGVVVGASRTAAQSDLFGVFVQATGGSVELVAFADRTRYGQMRMASGTLEDVPALSSPARFLANVPTWKHVSVWLSTRAIFTDDFAERRVVPFASRLVNVAATEIRVADFEDPARAAQLLKAVRASRENPAYLFISLDNGSVTRDYMIEVRPEDTRQKR